MDEKTYDKMIGAKLRILRKQHGISQTQLGKLVGITFQQIQKYERGINRIGGGRLYHFSEIFRVPIYDFFIYCHSGQKLDDDTDDMLKLIRLVKQITPEMLKVVNRLVKDLVNAEKMK